MSSPPQQPAEPGSADEAAPAPQISDNRATATQRSASPDQEPAANGVDALATASEPRRCFICLEDEVADDSLEWATPCTCSLAGHQDCLLTWVADLEMQGKDLSNLACPMCKSPIRVVDQFDFVIQLSDRLFRYFSKVSPLVLMSFVGGNLAIASAFYGVQALQVFAGPDAVAQYIFKQPKRGNIWATFMAGFKRAIPAEDNGTVLDWTRLMSLGLVGPALILNRMHLGELVMIPTSLTYAIFFSGGQRNNSLEWPPSPRMVLAAFPAIRAAYFHVYRACSKSIDKRLLQQLQNQYHNLQGEGVAQAAARRDDAEAEVEGDIERMIDIEIDLQLGGDNEAAAEVPNAPAPIRPNRPGNAVTSIFNYLAGALLWPTFSGVAGSLLQIALPKAWVTRSAFGPPTGILQERWGRSLVGGCLCVVLKDAFQLYVKYRRAINRPHRRIANVNRRNRAG